MKWRTNLTGLVAFTCISFATASPSWGHFLWLATEADGHAILYFSESPAVRDYRIPDAVARAPVRMLRQAGEPIAVELDPVESDEFKGRKSDAKMPTDAVLECEVPYGVYHGMRLDYFARHVASLQATAPPTKLKLAATPRIGAGGTLELVVQWDGQPLAGASVTMFDPQGAPAESPTDGDGVARFEAAKAGLLGFLVERSDPGAKGEIDGQKFTSAVAFGTVTVNYQPETDTGAAAPLPRLPEPLASFGGAVSDGWLYVYGGHIGEEHAHSRQNLSNHFRRVRLSGGSWDELPMQTPLQGLPLAAHGGKLYRIGGVNFRNAAEADPDMHSVADFAAFDPASNQWTDLAPLPEARSSHDAAVIGNTLYVVGGWTLSGKPRGEWLATAWSIDLSDSAARWQSVATPPFKRRALAIVGWQGKLVAIGGMDDRGEVSRRVNALDLSTGQWIELPVLPRGQMAGFGVSAWNLNGDLLASGADGAIYRLASDASAWDKVGSLATGRFFHRLLPGDHSTLLAVGGASPDDGHLKSIEAVRLSPSK